MMKRQKEEVYQTIGHRIAYFRKQKHWTQQELADRIYRNVSVISRVEQGKYNSGLSLGLLVDIVNALQVRLFVLFLMEEDRLFLSEHR